MASNCCTRYEPPLRFLPTRPARSSGAFEPARLTSRERIKRVGGDSVWTRLDKVLSYTLSGSRTCLLRRRSCSAAANDPLLSPMRLPECCLSRAVLYIGIWRAVLVPPPYTRYYVQNFTTVIW